jgi:hypothetical protein
MPFVLAGLVVAVVAVLVVLAAYLIVGRWF